MSTFLCDDNNPFYCPINAATFIHNLRHRPPSQDHQLRASFIASLLRKSAEDDLLHSHDTPVSSYNRTLSTIDRIYAVTPRQQIVPSLPTPAHLVPVQHSNYPKRSHQEYGGTFSDLKGSSQRGRSDDFVNYDSFELSGKADKIQYSYPDFTVSPPDHVFPLTGFIGRGEDGLIHRIQELEVELHGPRIGAETPESLHTLSERLDSLLPGIRLYERLSAVRNLTHQKIVDLLGLHGHLSGRILEVFRMSEVRFLDLSASMVDQSGLNLARRDLLKVFSKPNSFVFLSYMAIDNTPIRNFDMIHIHHLPRLSVLSLINTGIGNEAIYHLVCLKWSLQELYIDENPCINDEAIAPLLLLSKLTYLSIVDTSIEMVGLRRLAREVDEAGRNLDVQAPASCYKHVNHLDSLYMIDIKPPLVIDESACKYLSVAALQRNLSQHAAFNPKIAVAGSKAEMVSRLEEILATRKLDLLVLRLLAGEMGEEDETEDE